MKREIYYKLSGKWIFTDIDEGDYIKDELINMLTAKYLLGSKHITQVRLSNPDEHGYRDIVIYKNNGYKNIFKEVTRL